MRAFLFLISVYFSICLLTFFIALWGIFKKEKLKPYYTLIPFLNIYYYFKICNLPFWTIFIPVVNAITLWCASYVITKKYMCKRWQSLLAIFLPFVFLPYIAFSNKRNVDWFVEEKYVYDLKDIDDLEESLVLQKEYDLIPDNTSNINIAHNEAATVHDVVISNVEDNVQQDEYVYDDPIETKNDSNNVEEKIDNFQEIKDDVISDDLNITGIDDLEKNIKIDTSTEKSIEKNVKEFKETTSSNEAIAFGGEKRIENINAVQTKKDELKCPRCGSSLVGAQNICPGCGAKI